MAFEKFAELKQAAKTEQANATGIVRPDDGSAEWVYMVRPHGGDGYEWLLTSHDLSMRIGSWMEPKSRPSVMVDFRSEMLWTHGPTACVERVMTLLKSIHGQVVTEKVSRADLAVDVLLPSDQWNLGLLDHLVKRADCVTPYLRHDRLTGIQIGSGSVMARFYDKPLEIRTKSHKDWMYLIWKLDSIAPDHRIIRVEYQLRREVLKELGVDGFEDLLSNLPGIWAYCTRQWLKVHDDPDKHHTQQSPLPWWMVVQGGMDGALEATPSVRAKAISTDKQRHVQQVVGYLAAMTAIDRDGKLLGKDEVLDWESHLPNMIQTLRGAKMTNRKFTDRVKCHQANYDRSQEKFIKSRGKNNGIAVSLKTRRFEK